MRATIKRLGGREIAKLAFFMVVLLTTAAVFVLNPSLMPSTLISLLLFFLFVPIVNACERRGMGRGIAIALLFLTCGAGLTVSTSWVIPRITHEVSSFQEGSTKYTTNLTAKLRDRENRLRTQFPFLPAVDLTDSSIQWIKNSGAKVLKVLPNIASHLMMALFLVPFLTFILLKEAITIRSALLSLVPNRYFETVYAITSRIMDEMGGYVSARVLEAALMFFIVAVGCLALDIPYAFLLGFFAGATNPIPYLGPVIGAVPGILFAILDPVVPNQLAYVLLIYVAANVVDTVLIFPLVVAKIVNLHPLMVIICVILGSQLFGIVGMIVAVPITSILKILIQEAHSRVYDRITR